MLSHDIKRILGITNKSHTPKPTKSPGKIICSFSKPLISTYDDYASTASIMRESSIDIEKFFFCQIYFPNEKIHAGKCNFHVRLSPQPYWETLRDMGVCEYFSECLIQTDKDENQTLDYLLSKIDDGYMFRISVDYFFIPNITEFKTNHKHHVVTVAGYDYQNMIVIWGWFGLEYTERRLPFDLFLKSVQSTMSVAKTSRFEMVDFFRLTKCDTFAFRGYDFLLIQLKSYLSSVDPRTDELMSSFTRNKQDSLIKTLRYVINHKGAFDSRDVTWGANVNDAFVEYFKGRNPTAKPIDMRSVRVYWEHKYLMLRRMTLINEKLKDPTLQNVISDYRLIEKKARALKVLAFSFNRGELSKVFNDGNDAIAIIRHNESDLISKFAAILDSAIKQGILTTQ